MKKLAEILQNDIDKALSSELKKYDKISSNLGDAFLLHLADSIHNQMTRRSRFKKLAATKKFDSLLSYYKQIYPQDFAKGLLQDYKKSSNKKEK